MAYFFSNFLDFSVLMPYMPEFSLDSICINYNNVNYERIIL